MSDLDRELEAAIEEGEAFEAVDAGVVKPTEAETAGGPARRKSGWGLLAALLAISAGILTLLLTSGEDAIYAIKVDKLVAEQSRFAGRTVRAQGFLVKGSLLKRDDPCEYRFKIHNNQERKEAGPELAVRYPNCVVPDTFRDVPNIDVEVTAEGKLASDESGATFLEARHIVAKCPSKYEMQQKQLSGEKAPHQVGSAPAQAPPAAYNGN